MVAARTDVEVTAEGAFPAIVDYEDLKCLHRASNDESTPLEATIITGSRMVDTKVGSGGRVMYIGSELESTIRRIVDPFGNQAFIPIEQYAAAGTIMNGEIGKVDKFRIIVVPEMLHWVPLGRPDGRFAP